MIIKKVDSAIVKEKSVSQNVKAGKTLTKVTAKPASATARKKEIQPESRKAKTNKVTSATPVSVAAHGEEADKTTPTVTVVPPPAQQEEAKIVDNKVLVAKDKKKQESETKKGIKNGVDKAEKKILVGKSKNKSESKPKKTKNSGYKSDNSLSKDSDSTTGQRAYSAIITDPHSMTESKTPVSPKVKPATPSESITAPDKKSLLRKSNGKVKPNKSKTPGFESDTLLSTNEDLMTGQRTYSTIITDSHSITEDELIRVNTRPGITALLRQKKINLKKINYVLDYEEELKLLQIELLKLQRTVQEQSQRVVIIFEGRDAAGKGGTIRRFVEHLNPRVMRVIALPIPTKEEVGQWYFQRYIKQLPNRGEMVFFDRSWYNRAVVEPVNGFCTKAEYQRYMLQVPEFEHMLFEEGISLIKFYFSISRREQVKRFKARRENPLKQWKLSPLDAKAQSLWDDYTQYKEMMFSKTHTTTSPWMIVQANNKLKARLESIRYVISTLEYEGKGTSKVRLLPDPNVVSRYNRGSISIE